MLRILDTALKTPKTLFSYSMKIVEDILIMDLKQKKNRNLVQKHRE